MDGDLEKVICLIKELDESKIKLLGLFLKSLLGYI